MSGHLTDPHYDKLTDQLNNIDKAIDKRLTKIETILETIIKYQLDQNSTAIKDHERRLINLEKVSYKIIAWASAGSFIGGLVFNLLADIIKDKLS